MSRIRYEGAFFLTSALSLADAPADEGREVAFAGRSNSGKSSALNAITGRRSLALTSKTPGRTQLLNFFGLSERKRLVDLPGYGYARVPEGVRRRWRQALDAYLRHRRSLQGVMLVMDIRHPLTEFDRQMLAWCRHSRLAVHVLLTKSDKLKRGPAVAQLSAVREDLAQQGLDASVQLFSSLQGSGVEEARRVLDGWLGGEPQSAA